jgi:hypothetical protein
MRPRTEPKRPLRERHTVTVVPGGFVWREATYASLSNIARAITGTAWNGPRFFGLRGPGNPAPVKPTEAPRKHRAGRSAGARRRPARGRPPDETPNSQARALRHLHPQVDRA